MQGENKKRVVVSGMGIVSAIGIGQEEFADALFHEANGIRTIELFDSSGYRTDKAAYVTNIGKAAEGEKDRIYQFLDLICEEMVKNSGLNFSEIDMDKVGVSIGTCLGNVDCMDRFYEDGAREEHKISVKVLVGQPHFIPSTYVANKYNVKNVVCSVDTACASGTNAIGYAVDRIKYGDADIMIAGGIDPFCRLSQSGFGGLRSLSVTVPKPFTTERDGLILGEGGGLVILEELEHAKARNAVILAEVLGYGLSNDAYHETKPDPQGGGAKRAIENCLKDAVITAEQISYINAHGTGTQFNDSMELKSITNVFQNHKIPPISTIKPQVGHALGAAGSIEFIACVLGLIKNKIPATCNFTQPITGYEQYDFVQNKSRDAEVDVILSNSFAFAGNSACIAIKRYTGG